MRMATHHEALRTRERSAYFATSALPVLRVRTHVEDDHLWRLFDHQVERGKKIPFRPSAGLFRIADDLAHPTEGDSVDRHSIAVQQMHSVLRDESASDSIESIRTQRTPGWES